MNTTKLCAGCKQDKPLSCFSKCKYLSDGLQFSCKECQSLRWKRYKAEKADKIRAKQREYHDKPETKEHKSRLRTSEEGRKKACAYMAEYRKKNRQKIYEYELKYNARVKANGGLFTNEDWETLKSMYKNKCLACGGTDRLVADHVIPVALGGPNGIENRQLLCHSCNSKKSDGTTDFRPRHS